MENIYDNTNVIELDDRDIKDFKIVRSECKDKYGMVIFYAPWCPHCTDMVKPLDYLSNQLENHGVIFGAVNCTQQQGLAQSYQIQSFPTLYTLYPSGQLELYKGRRSIEDLLNWLVELTNHKTKPPSPINLDNFTDSDGESIQKMDDSMDNNSVDMNDVKQNILDNILKNPSMDSLSKKESIEQPSKIDSVDENPSILDKVGSMLQPTPPTGDNLYDDSIEKTDSMIVRNDRLDLGSCNSKNAIIIAYMPWCIHCKNMVDTVTNLKANGRCVFTINCQLQPKFTKLFRIDGFPTILYRKATNSTDSLTNITDLQKYNGPRSLEALTTLLETGDPSQIGGAFMCPAISWQLFPCSIM